MALPASSGINAQPQKPKGAARAVFDDAQNDPEDSDDQEFDEMRTDEGKLDEDHSLNDGSSAMSDRPSNGPNNHFDDKFGE